MDPKHQFAAQYVLSRAAAERRERESLLAAAALASSTGALPLGLSGTQSSLCPSPSVHSDSSSQNGDGRLSSTGSEPPTGLMLHNNNNSSSNNNNNNNNTNNNNTNNNNNENVAAMKLAELMVGKTGKG